MSVEPVARKDIKRKAASPLPPQERDVGQASGDDWEVSLGKLDSAFRQFIRGDTTDISDLLVTPTDQLEKGRNPLPISGGVCSFQTATDGRGTYVTTRIRGFYRQALLPHNADSRTLHRLLKILLIDDYQKFMIRHAKQLQSRLIKLKVEDPISSP
jgi:hypothetical protein